MGQLVFIENNRPVTDSLTVLEVFEKPHDKVLRDIRELGCSEEFSLSNFGESTYTNERGRLYPKVIMTEQGFTLLAMGYTGPKAMEFKEKYITEFHLMREQLNQPKTHLEILQASIAQLVEQERRLVDVENRMSQTERKLDSQSELLALHPTEWRKKTNNIINRIAKSLGGYDAYQNIRNESYKLLEERAKCQLSVRLTNKRQKMSLEGVAKSKIDKVTKVDVIADDARLTEIYLSIVKEMAIKYQLDLEESREVNV